MNLKTKPIKLQKKLSLNGKILEFRKKHTLEETGNRFDITGERVRQIEFLIKRKRCLIHNRYFYNKCSFCLDVKNYKLYMERLDYSSLLLEIKKEAKNKRRDYLSTQRRIYLVKRLYDKGEKSFTEIAKMLDRHHDTIKYLYNKKQ